MEARLKRKYITLLLINLALILGFGSFFVARLNYEFIIYVGVIGSLRGSYGGVPRPAVYPYKILVKNRISL